MAFHAPQVIWFVIAGIGLGVSLVEDGKPRKDRVEFFPNLIAFAIQCGLLWWGGFFG